MNIFKFLLIVAIFSFNQSHSQELKKKKKVSGNYLEEYTVLKEDKKIRHGQYIKYRIDILDNKSISVIGQFNSGKKIGNWFYFYPNGQLEIEGRFENDQKEGLWRYYYRPLDDKPNISSLFEVNKGLIFKEDGNVEVDKSNLTISSEGVFRIGTKIGSWNYYTREGQLFHKFDHSSNELISGIANDSLNRVCPFLGGVDRFNSQFFAINTQLSTTLPSSNSKVILKLIPKHSPISVEIIKSIGDDEFIKSVLKTIETMDNDYILDFVDGKNGALIFTAEFEKQLNRNIFTIGFDSHNQTIPDL